MASLSSLTACSIELVAHCDVEEVQTLDRLLAGLLLAGERVTSRGLIKFYAKEYVCVCVSFQV